MSKISSKNLDYFNIYKDRKKGYFYYSKLRKKGFLLPKEKLRIFMVVQSRHYIILLTGLILMSYFNIDLLQVSVILIVLFLFVEFLFNFIYLKELKTLDFNYEKYMFLDNNKTNDKKSIIFKALFPLTIGLVSLILIFLFKFTNNERMIIILLSTYSIFLGLKSIFLARKNNNHEV